MENIESVIKEIREKINNNPKYLHPCNKERLDDILKYGFENAANFNRFLKYYGILRNSSKKGYQKGSLGYLSRRANKDGFNNLSDWNRWRISTGKLNITEIEKQYQNSVFQNIGYKNKAEYDRELSYSNGIRLPSSENSDCPLFLGVIIGEEIAIPILIEIFGCISERMCPQNPGFDFIVNGGGKVDVKTALLNMTNSGSIGWSYPIRYNRIADYFLLIAMDDLENRNILHIWLMYKNDIINSGSRKFCSREKIWMTN